MAAVKDTLTWAGSKAELFAVLGMQPNPQSSAVLELLFNAAVAEADKYMENPFTDDAGADVPLPPFIKLGVYEYCRVLYAYLKAKSAHKSVKTLQLAEVFRDGTAPVAAFDAARGFWVKEKIDLTTDGRWS